MITFQPLPLLILVTVLRRQQLLGGWGSIVHLHSECALAHHFLQLCAGIVLTKQTPDAAVSRFPTSERQIRTYTHLAETNALSPSSPLQATATKKGPAHLSCLLLLFQARIHRKTCSFTRKLPRYCQTAFHQWRKYLFQGLMMKQLLAFQDEVNNLPLLILGKLYLI